MCLFWYLAKTTLSYKSTMVLVNLASTCKILLLNIAKTTLLQNLVRLSKMTCNELVLGIAKTIQNFSIKFFSGSCLIQVPKCQNILTLSRVGFVKFFLRKTLKLANIVCIACYSISNLIEFHFNLFNSLLWI